MRNITMDFSSRTVMYSNSSSLCSSCAYRSRCVINKISANEIDGLSRSFISRKAFHEGQHLYRRGDPFVGVYSLRYGTVKNELVFRDGVTQVTHFSIPGEVLGVDGLGNDRHQLDSICLSSVEVCSISIQDINGMTKNFPEFMGNVTSTLSALLNISYAHNYDLVNLNSLERVADFLIGYSNRLSTVGFDRDNFILPMSRPDLANYLGVTIETLSRSLTHLEKINVIAAKNREIRFISREPIFEFLNSVTLREKHELMKGKSHSYPPFDEKRKP
ncbi:Crp/Fnr family transcriptional regulator [Polynucleobacter sp. AP-Reno-20A-A9]|uniref:Crp/Fnr family transcriptional regulator n=1 Tax=Polynucleobacter sp. AP-Reno-20A-A9 TaxID=2576925 RepID=UPI001C0CA65C|nr:helix-turn-helix domain-containing protein [Polynucleobacter sp. AP-Reno-20A-A9]MBU3628593.1 helix-turn-helix domain-containing protein [Polynucleobacter sp. AP-Reno-20A-A9]